MIRVELLLSSALLLVIASASSVRAESGGDPVMGKRLFAQCGSCHTTAAGGPSPVGPNLHGLFGRKAGSLPGFAYSEAMQASKIVWSDTELDAYIKQPSSFVPGTKMVFMGVAKDKARADILAYLKEATK